MGKTLRGIFHNIKESTYTISNTEIVFFFSSKLYMNKFMEEYQNNRIKVNEQTNKIMDNPPLNMNMLADVALYKRIEKRGFYVWMKELTLSCDDLHDYAVRRMKIEQTLNWYQYERPTLENRLRM